MKFGIKPISQFRRNLKKNKRLNKICRFPQIFGILNYNGIHKRQAKRITAATQKADFPVPNEVLWLIENWSFKSSFVVKVSPFGKLQTVVHHFKKPFKWAKKRSNLYI